MEPTNQPHDLFPEDLANELLALLQAARRDPKLNEVLQALVLMTIGDVAHHDLKIVLPLGESIHETLLEFWRIAYQEGFGDGEKGGADGTR
jgi:hypothetical protein